MIGMSRVIISSKSGNHGRNGTRRKKMGQNGVWPFDDKNFLVQTPKKWDWTSRKNETHYYLSAILC